MITSRYLWIIALVPGLAGSAVAETEVRGALPADAVWTAAASPYVATQNVEIPAGGKLRIEPGVTIHMRKHFLVVSGTLDARGTKDRPIVFTSGDAKPRPGTWGRIEFMPKSIAAKLDAGGKCLEGSIMEHCVVEYGGGLLIDRSAPCIRNCVIRLNAGEHAGGVFINGSQPIIRDNEILYNRSKRDGGGIRTIQCAPTIEKNRIAYNHADGAGGGIATDMKPSLIRGNSITHNSAQTGGGIATGVTAIGQSYLSGTDRSSPIVEENVVSHNAASTGGGGIYILGVAVVRNNHIVNNTLNYAFVEFKGTDNPTPEYSHPYRGAGLFIEQTHAGRADIERNIIVGNHGARWGGGVFLTRAGAVLRDNRILYNEAEHGGGVYAVLTKASQSIGGKYRDESFVFEQNEISSNQGSGVEFAGGGPQAVTIRSCNLFGNVPKSVSNMSGLGIQASGNWWGEGRVSDQIHDFFVDKRLGKVEAGEPAGKAHALEKTPDLKELDRAWLLASPKELRAGLSAQAEGEPTATIGVAWKAPALEGIVGYRVHVSSDVAYGAGAAWLAGVDALETRETRARVTGLTLRKRYYVTVTAFDAHGRETRFAPAVQVHASP